MKNIIYATLAAIMLSYSAQAAIIFEDNFGNNDITTGGTGDTNAGWAVSSGDNDGGGDPALPSETVGGTALLDTTSNGGFARVNMNSNVTNLNLGDGSTDVTWNVAISSADLTDPDGGALKLALGPAANTTGAGFDTSAGSGLYIHFASDLSQYQLMAGDGSARDILFSDNTITASNFADGWSFEAVVNDSGWSFDLTGAGTDDVSTSGNWGAIHDFDNIFGVTGGSTSSGLNVFMRDQGNGSNQQDLNVEIDSISVDAIPEPSALSLMMGALGALYLLRRKR